MGLSKRKRIKRIIFRLDVGFALILVVIGSTLFLLSHNKNLMITNATTAHPPTINQKRGIRYGVALGSSATTWSKGKMSKNFNQLRHLGVTSVRFDIPWSSLQPTDATHFNWVPYDALISKANESNLSSLVILDYTPKWARHKDCENTQMCPPADNEQFADYARAVVKRYQPKGVNTYEIWNEQNSVQFWQPYPDPIAYQKLLHVTSTAMRTQSQGITILTGGMSPAGDPKEAIAPRDYLKQLYAAGAKNDFDGVAFHPYTSPFLVNQSEATNWNLMDSGTDNIRETMATNGDSLKKIWITEYGAATGGSGNGATSKVTSTNYDHVNESLQSEIVKTAVNSAESKPWLASLYWYTLQDGPTGSKDKEGYFGLLDSNDKPKPSFSQFKDALRTTKR